MITWNRHCERSEAISFCTAKIASAIKLPRNDIFGAKISLLLLTLSILGMASCTPPTPRLVIKYSQEGKLLALEKLSAGQQPAWSPDGQQIAYIDNGIWLMSIDGKTKRHINSNGAKPSFSRDGKQLLYEQTGGVWALDLATEQKLELIKQGQQPALSPDGKKIAYADDNGIALWDIEKSAATPIPPKGLNPVWSKDGQQLFYDSLSNSQLYFDLWRYDFNTQKQTKIMADAVQPAISPDGQYLLCSSNGIWLLPLQNENPKEGAIRITLYGYEPAYSPKGDKIVFSFKGDIWIMDAPYILKGDKQDAQSN